MLVQSIVRRVVFACVFVLTATTTRGDSEIVIAIRYLQAKGISHSHLYLYREDGKLLRQLTNNNSGQDNDPIFASDGETIVFTREKPNDGREFWSVDPSGKKLTRLAATPDWYSSAKSSPAFTRAGDEESPEPAPTSLLEQSALPGATAENVGQPQHESMTALDAVADAADRPPQIIKAPDNAGEIFWRKGQEGEGPDEELNWIMWFRDPKTGQETEIGRLPGFPSLEPLRLQGGKDKEEFLFEGPLRLMFFSTHLNSTDGDTVEAFDFNKRKLIRLSPNYATPFPLPGEPAFLTLTENRYVNIPGSSKTANCSYVELWGAKIKERCFDESEPPYYGNESPYCGGEAEARYARKGSAAICYGASMFRPGKDPAVITIRSGAD